MKAKRGPRTNGEEGFQKQIRTDFEGDTNASA